MQNASAVPALTRQLSDPDAGVRAAVLRALGELHDASSLDSITASLDDADPKVRCDALVSLSRFDIKPDASLVTKLENLLQDGSINVRTQSVVTLSKMGHGDKALQELAKWAKADDSQIRISALETFRRIAPFFDGSLDPAPVLTALRDSSIPTVRVAACHALAGFKSGVAWKALVACLSDPDLSVRNAAAGSLRLDGSYDPSLILDVLDSKVGFARDAALDALSPGVPQSIARLRIFAGQEIENLRSHFAEVASLPATGRAVALLCEALQHQVERHESRLVKVVGLVGNPRVMDLVRKSLHGSDPEVRAAALEALETLGDKSLAHGILTLLDEEPARMTPAVCIEKFLSGADPWLCALSVRAVQELDLKEFIPRLSELKTSSDALIKESALEALEQFGEVKPMDTLQTVSTLERVLLLREVPIFADLSPEDLQQVAGIASEQWFPNSTTIFHQGDEGDRMFIIVDGQVQVVRSVDGREQTIAQRGPGDFVGEMAIIESVPRLATLVTQGEVRVLAIEGETFKQILRERPEVSLAVLRSVSRRLRERSA
jgi:HEAT repeat protein